MPRPGDVEAARRPFLRCGAPSAMRPRDVAVEVGRGEQELRRRAVRQVRDRGRHDVAAPAVFERHRDPERHAQVAGLLRLRQPAELADLEVHHVHRPVGVPAHQHVDAVDHLVQHERMIGVPADREAFLVGQARLLDVDVDVAHRPHHARGLVHQPAGVRVGDEPVARLQHRRDRADARDVRIRVAADLQLEAAIAFGAIARDAFRPSPPATPARSRGRGGSRRRTGRRAARTPAARPSGRECPSTRCRPPT